MTTTIETSDDPAAASLVFTSDDMPGISRRRSGKGFTYRDPHGRTIRDKSECMRIRALAIPPAYRDVWICPLPNGHLQATGRDARDRKQYRYHPDFRAERDRDKFAHLIAFARALPGIRARVHADMKLRGLPRAKVLATIVHLLDISMIRVGNTDYARQNRSFGLTTLQRRHAALAGSTLRMTFKGKSGQPWDVTIRDRRVARLLKAMQELPGQHLFQYLDDDGEASAVNSSDVNAYLKAISGSAITAKDFRTWHGTVLAALELAACAPVENVTASRRVLAAAIDRVAARLGNTRTVCRTCYIHPAVIAGFEGGTLRIRIGDAGTSETTDALNAGEKAVLNFLRRAARAQP
ncbi:DNA topoisomerase IB [Sphingobium algorifonticola]|uniref:DNA topoisomerase IB n=1 Tax=Sphingobium algorifonticola TaxID=2008318 RepID=A0A437JD55_9SPHN|nr:DNA topoisomerase IB [Sphingobium algorifonticola]RVT43804.1 DNA topoisomerase IB [Sphingobium algorifonticola]